MSNNQKNEKMVTKNQNFKVTNISYDGKYDGLSMFEMEVNKRWSFTVEAEVLDVNREELDIAIVKVTGSEQEFEPKLRYESAILDAIHDYCNADDETFRDSPEDWADYYAELNADAARYM